MSKEIDELVKRVKYQMREDKKGIEDLKEHLEGLCKHFIKDIQYSIDTFLKTRKTRLIESLEETRERPRENVSLKVTPELKKQGNMITAGAKTRAIIEEEGQSSSNASKSESSD